MEDIEIEVEDVEIFEKILRQLYSFYKEENNDYKELILTMQVMRDNYEVFDTCTNLTSFIEGLSNIKVTKFNLNNLNNIIDKDLLDLTILDSQYNFRAEWIEHIVNVKGELISKNRFEALIGLCGKIAKEEGGAFANECYVFFRMEILIKNPIITMNTFKSKLSKVLKNKCIKYERDFIKIFKEVYIIAEKYPMVWSEYKLGEVCTHCGYFLGEDKHAWCGEFKSSKMIDYDNHYIIKGSVYRDYTRPGLIERDTFNRLKEEGFKVGLYPELEAKGDLVIEINNEIIYIDCKTTKSMKNLWNEVLETKYINRIIVVPKLHYNEHKEYFRTKGIETGHNIKIYDIADLLTYLKRKRGKKNV